MKRKLVKIGNSLAVTLPRDMVKEMDLKPGMEVDATVDPRDGSFVVRAGVKVFENGKASPRFKKMVDGLIRERRKLYERLS
jgi:putative addiction module antidote